MKIETEEDKADLALALGVLCDYSMNHPITGPRALRFAHKLFNDYAENAHPFDADLMREDANTVHIEQGIKI